MFKMYIDHNHPGALIFEVNNKLFHVTSREAMLQFLDFDEIKHALSEMEKYGHDAADFGINKTFIYSFDREEEKAA